MYLSIKRILDVIFAVVLLTLTAPLMLLIVSAIKLDSKGPVLFKQKRVGKDGKVFTIYKFRTMIPETSKDGRALSDMERLTRIGAFLRRTSLDELPQLFNVVKGEMSFVGPRPLLVEYLDYYTPRQMRRHEVRPGITGWAQVNGRNAISWEEKFELDIWYVDNISLWIDGKIVLSTLWIILSKHGINRSENETMSYFRGTKQIEQTKLQG